MSLILGKREAITHKCPNKIKPVHFPRTQDIFLKWLDIALPFLWVKLIFPHTFSHFFSSSIFSSFCPLIISNISECSYRFTISWSCLPSSLLKRLPWLQLVLVCPFEFLLCLIVCIASLLFIQLYKGHREQRDF